ncbi:DUF6440 family protein [Eubacterium sp. An3]|uniref:DUF6440 family protein n=1 Tax=Eubacterium sp. An3 TaxID=1965628 RepID=UPI000B38A273|nr:DUF6440 family protein [Eubacterium sp. An3]OUO25388.1 hypothetical protein B5F87_17485 [Eubacterium sp. An3]
MKKKLMITAMAVCLLLSGCSGSENEETEKSVSSDWIHVYVDEKTGVNYLVYSGYKSGGITPRYNPDGSLYIEGQE